MPFPDQGPPISAQLVQVILTFATSAGLAIRSALSRFAEHISLADWDAVGDGTTDTGTQLASVTGAALVPYGQNYYSATNDIPMQASVLYGFGAGSLISAALALPANAVVRNVASSTGSGQNFITSASGVRVVDCDITNTAAEGIQFAGANNITGSVVRHSRINTPNYGVLLNTTGFTGGSKVSAIGNDITSANADALEFNAPQGGSLTAAFKGTIALGNFLQVTASTGGGSAGFAYGNAACMYNVVSMNVILEAQAEMIHIEDSQRGTSIIGNVGAGLADGIRIFNANFYNALPLSAVGNALENSGSSPTSIGIEIFWNSYGTLSGCSFMANVLHNFSEGINVGGGAGSVADVTTIAYGNSIVGCTYGITAWGNAYNGTVRQAGVNVMDSTPTLFYTKSKSARFGKAISHTRPTAIMANSGLYSSTLPSSCDGFEFPLSAAIAITSSSGGQTLFPVGGPLHGRVKFQAKSASPGTDWCAISADLDWNGATLAVTNVNSRVAGIITSISITEGGSGPFVNIRSSSNTTLQAGWVEFDGEYWDA